jgi:hypothetical protein
MSGLGPMDGAGLAGALGEKEVGDQCAGRQNHGGNANDGQGYENGFF